MKKILLIASLAVSFMACEQDEKIVATQQPESGVLKRSSSRNELPLNAVGPAAHPAGTVSFEPPANARVADISFIPNAGVIKTEADGQTHLEVLQLPGIPGSRQVKWQSLSTGWEGSTDMILNPNGFYVVWNNSVYKVPKTKLNSWSLVLPNNGETIRAIESDPASGGNGYLVRGNTFYRFKTSFDNSFKLTAIASDFPNISSTEEMAYASTGDFDWDLLIKTGSHNPHRMIRYFFRQHPLNLAWSTLDFYQVPVFVSGRMVGNSASRLVYETRSSHPSRVFTINPHDGGTALFSTAPFAPQSAPLVVNNGYVWIMGNTLSQLMTFGSQKGNSAYNEWGWDGITVACAAPFEVFN
jgi:hypothetical protein